MKMRDLIDIVSEDGIIKNFVTGWDGQAPVSKPKEKAAPQAASSPFDQLNSKDAKAILGAVIAGKPLQSYQIELLKKVYRDL